MHPLNRTGSALLVRIRHLGSLMRTRGGPALHSLRQASTPLREWFADRFHESREATTHWIRRFRRATPRGKARMLALPVTILLLLGTISATYHYFLPPAVVTIFPNDDATAIRHDTPLEILFDRPVRRE